jgi:hypothetical protein
VHPEQSVVVPRELAFEIGAAIGELLRFEKSTLYVVDLETLIEFLDRISGGNRPARHPAPSRIDIAKRPATNVANPKRLRNVDRELAKEIVALTKVIAASLRVLWDLRSGCHGDPTLSAADIDM